MTRAKEELENKGEIEMKEKNPDWAFTNNKWVHVAISTDSGNEKVYINGKEYVPAPEIKQEENVPGDWDE